jgi:hypothetical protein
MELVCRRLPDLANVSSPVVVPTLITIFFPVRVQQQVHWEGQMLCNHAQSTDIVAQINYVQYHVIVVDETKHADPWKRNVNES